MARPWLCDSLRHQRYLLTLWGQELQRLLPGVWLHDWCLKAGV